VRIYEQMPEPKFVVAVGTCACSGGVFKGCYNVMDGIDSIIPVSAYIPGCPASPQAIIDGVVKLLASLKGPSNAESGVEASQPAPVGAEPGKKEAVEVTR
jgi:NADH:ubiquinone oxidoreductase subunit B-like Fe-S oxidoreductase